MSSQSDHHWTQIAEEIGARRPVVLATLVRDSGSVPRRTGARMLIYPDRRTRGTVGGGMFELYVIRDALAALAAGRSQTRSYSFTPRGVEADSFGAVCGGRAEVFLEVLMPRDRLLIVGGGHCGRALAQMAVALDFDVVVTDDRAEFLKAQDFPPGVGLVAAGEDFSGLPEVDRQTYVVLVSKGYITDEAALRRVMVSPAAYIGMIGSLNKRDTVFFNIYRSGTPRDLLDRVHAPIGLEIGAESPAEIAVSILAEIIQCRAAMRSRAAKEAGAAP